MSNTHNPWLHGIESQNTEILADSSSTDRFQLGSDSQSITIVVKTDSPPTPPASKITVNSSEQKNSGIKKIMFAAFIATLLIGYIKRDEILDFIQTKTEDVRGSTTEPVVNSGGSPMRENLRSTAQTNVTETSIIESGCSPVLVQETDSTFTDDISKSLCWSTGEIVGGLQNGIPRSVGTISLSANNTYGPISDDVLSSWFETEEITDTELSAFVAYNVIAPAQDTVLYVLNNEGEPFVDALGDNLIAKIAGSA